jgi:hypothetical protein
VHLSAGTEVVMRGTASRFLLVCALFALPPTAVSAQGTSGPTVRDSNVGYLDSALLGDQFRFRYDSSYGVNRPARAEFFWPRGAPDGPGPARPETSVDYQDLSAYLETQVSERLSGFVELPVRFLNPEVNANAAGLADMNAGFKFAFWQQNDCVATLQLRAYFPTGDADRGLGNNHYSLEPALLLYKPINEKIGADGELRFWAPLGGTSFAGEVIRYGVGLHYDAYESCGFNIVPVVELIGWTVVGGRETVPLASGIALPRDASGDTIVNVKVGCHAKVKEWGDLYVGYGRALTGDRWYENTFRLEFRVFY